MKQKYLNVRKLFLAAAMTAMLCSCSDKMTQQANLEIVPKPNMLGYRSGHNGAVLKTVRVKAHAGSNPAPSAK